MEFCNFSFMPVIAKHIPGVANKLADELSRRYQPRPLYTSDAADEEDSRELARRSVRKRKNQTTGRPPEC